MFHNLPLNLIAAISFFMLAAFSFASESIEGEPKFLVFSQKLKSNITLYSILESVINKVPTGRGLEFEGSMTSRVNPLMPGYAEEFIKQQSVKYRFASKEEKFYLSIDFVPRDSVEDLSSSYAYDGERYFFFSKSDSRIDIGSKPYPIPSYINELHLLFLNYYWLADLYKIDFLTLFNSSRETLVKNLGDNLNKARAKLIGQGKLLNHDVWIIECDGGALPPFERQTKYRIFIACDMLFPIYWQRTKIDNTLIFTHHVFEFQREGELVYPARAIKKFYGWGPVENLGFPRMISEAVLKRKPFDHNQDETIFYFDPSQARILFDRDANEAIQIPK